MSHTKSDLEDTHITPPPAGPAALNIDIKVIAIPLAAPLWCCSYWLTYGWVDKKVFVFITTSKDIKRSKYTIKNEEGEIPQLYFVEWTRLL